MGHLSHRSVTIPRPGSSTGPATSLPDDSSGLLSETRLGGDDHRTVAWRGSPVGLNSRSIHARPSALGASDVTITSGGSTRKSERDLGRLLVDRHDDHRPAPLGAESGGGGRVELAVRANRVAELGRAVLARLVVRLPVVVHHVGVERLRRFEPPDPAGRAQVARHVDRDRAHLDQAARRPSPRSPPTPRSTRRPSGPPTGSSCTSRATGRPRAERPPRASRSASFPRAR